MKTNRRFLIFWAGVSILILLLASLPQAEVTARQGAWQEERTADPASGKLIFLGAKDGLAASSISAAAVGLTPEDAARVYAEQYGPAFGLAQPASQLALTGVQVGADGGAVARFQQVHNGVPVLGASLLVRLAPGGGLKSMSGNLRPGLDLGVTPSVSSQDAVSSAREWLSKTRKVNAEALAFGEPELRVYDARLFDDASQAAPRLVWLTEAELAGSSMALTALVDAHTGVVRLDYDQPRLASAAPAASLPAAEGDSIQAFSGGGTAKWRICTSGFEFRWGCGLPEYDVWDNDGLTMRSNILCDQSTPEACDDWLAGAVEAMRTYPVLENAHALFNDHFGRNGWDAAGGNWDAHINYGSERDLNDPYWYPMIRHGALGEAVFGDTTAADDIVAREYAYDLVRHDTGLMNMYQSGAIAESLADMWGEFVDQNNVFGNDTAAARWLIGEDVYPGTTNYMRNMKLPPLKKQPDSMTSALYYKGPLENGQPEVNSGVNNKAVFLMVDGGKFGGFTVGKIEWQKVAAVYYKAQTDYLFPSADYYDLYLALNAVCKELISTTPYGAKTPISTVDCGNVDKALKAVKMHLKPPLLSAVAVPACPAGSEKGQTLFGDDFNTGNLDQWAFGANKFEKDGSNKQPIDEQVSWTTLAGVLGNDSDVGGHVNRALYAPGIANLNVLIPGDPGQGQPDNYEVNSAEEWARFQDVVALPAGKPVYLTFDHMYLFEVTPLTLSPFDGGVVEYSRDGGLTWTDAKPLFNLGHNYNAIIPISTRQPFTYNPLMGQSAFVGSSLAGRVATRYNLSSLAGQPNVMLRWRIGYDYTAAWGWAIDNVSLHTCIKLPAVPYLLTPANGALVFDNPVGVYQPRLDWRDSIPDLAYYKVQVATDAKFLDMVYEEDVTISEFTPPASLEPNTRYYWRVRAFNMNDNAMAWSAARSFRTSMLRPVNLSEPPDTLQTHTRRPTFVWDDPNTIGPAAKNYTIQVSRNDLFTSLVGTYTTLTNATYYAPLVDLPANSKLYWRVKANGTNPSAYTTEVLYFYTGNPPSVPALVAPAHNVLLQPDPVTLENKPYLDWNIVTLPFGVMFKYYQVQVSDDSLFANLIVDEKIYDINQHQYQVETALAPNTVHYWRVRAFALETDDFSGWATRAFRTAMLPPVIDPPNAPEDGQPVHTRRPTFRWTACDGATGYTIQASINPTFATVNFTYTVKTPADSYTHTADMVANTTYYWRIRANGLNGPSQYSNAHSFTTGNPPTVPAMVAPANNALVTNPTPLLDWGTSTVPLTPIPTTFSHYELQWADNPDFTDAVSRDVNDIVNHAYQLVGGEELLPNTRYYWRVRAWNTDGDSSGWSLVRYFRSAMLAPQILTAPEGQLNNRRPEFAWEASADATGYTIQLSTSPVFASINFTYTVSKPVTTYVHTTDLPANTTYYWRIRANGPNGPSLYSADSLQFKTANPPGVPALLSPANNALVTTHVPTLDWGASTLPTGTVFDKYELQWADNAAFENAEVREVTGIANHLYTIGYDEKLAAGSTFYWRVRAWNDAGEYSGWSAVRYFRTP